jgi:short-subunit dehydrogenase
MKKNIWIIGASSGIGMELAKIYISQGHNVAISARTNHLLENLANENSEFFKNILPLALDVRNQTDVDVALKKIIEKWQKIDLLIYASAIYDPEKIRNFDIKYSKEVIDINLTSIFNFLLPVVDEMKKNQSGQIALIASVAGYRGLPNSGAYGASKAAIINLCESLYVQLKPFNISISVVNPGFVKSKLTDKNDFKMPFIIEANKAAKIIVRGLKKKKFEIHFPLIFTLILKILQIMPNSLFFRVSGKMIK